jgi:hypothetical protein
MLIIAGAVVIAIVLVGVFVFGQAAQPAYACSNMWQPSATSSPAAGSSAQPGYIQPDMGNKHVAVGTRVTYTYCPPASGYHYNASGQGPIKPRVYGPSDAAKWANIDQTGGSGLDFAGVLTQHELDPSTYTPASGWSALTDAIGTLQSDPAIPAVSDIRNG